MNWLLSFLFPVRLPKLTPETSPVSVSASADPYHTPVTEDGVLWRAYDVRRTGVEKMERYLATSEQYARQLVSAQFEIAKLEEDLIAQGYVNTIHDCWEKPE